MCGCEANNDIRSLVKDFKKRQSDTGRTTRQYKFTVCSGTTYTGKIRSVEDEFVVLRIDSGYRMHEDAYLRFCCLCVVTEFESSE